MAVKWKEMQKATDSDKALADTLEVNIDNALRASMVERDGSVRVCVTPTCSGYYPRWRVIQRELERRYTAVGWRNVSIQAKDDQREGSWLEVELHAPAMRGG